MQDFSEWPAPAKALAGLFACVLVAALWSVIASTVFLLGTGMLAAHLGIPFLDWWRYADFYGFGNPVVGLWLKIAAGIATLLPVLLVVGRIMRKGLPGTKRELHGETKFAASADLRQDFRARFGGLYVGYTGARNYLRFGGPEHVACYAPTRSGKGVGLVVPNCLLYEGSLVCLDMKKSNFAASAGARAAAGQRVFLFDPLAADSCTARYNPLSYVRRNNLDAFEDIQRIAQMIFPHVAGDQAFWTDSARSAFVGATAFLAETPELPLTIGQVLRLLSSVDGAASMIERIEARRAARDPYTEATVKALEDYLKGSADLVNSIRKTITAKLSLWFNPRIDAATSESDFDLREVRNSLHAIYVGITPDNIKRLQPLLALFFQQLIDLNIRTLPQLDKNAKHQVLVLLDEFTAIGPMPVLADAFAFVAEYNIRLLLVMQSKAQLRDRDMYGPDKAAAILDNCGVEVVFGTKDLQLCKELSERLGYDTVEATSRSGPRFWRIFRGKNLNLTESDQRRALLLPQEIMRLKPRDAIIVRPGMYPIRCKRIRYYKDRTFTQYLFRPPVVEPIEIIVRMDQGKGFAPSTGIPAAPQGKATQATAAVAAAADPDEAASPSSKLKTKGKSKKTGKQDAEETSPAKTAEPVSHAPSTKNAVAGMRPHQANTLLNSVLGTDIDLTEFAREDGRNALASVLAQMPTVESLNRGRGVAAE